MSYYDISLLSADNDFIQRTRACASTENIPDPVQWAIDNQWQMAAMPGFGEKYSYALETGHPSPGRDQAVISDADILSAVQSLNTPATS